MKVDVAMAHDMKPESKDRATVSKPQEGKASLQGIESVAEETVSAKKPDAVEKVKAKPGQQKTKIVKKTQVQTADEIAGKLQKGLFNII